MMTYQTTDTPKPDRTDHVWIKVINKHEFKCCLCGAVTNTIPPNYPTPMEWIPKLGYEKLTPAERELVPFTRR